MQEAGIRLLLIGLLSFSAVFSFVFVNNMELIGGVTGYKRHYRASNERSSANSASPIVAGSIRPRLLSVVHMSIAGSPESTVEQAKPIETNMDEIVETRTLYPADACAELEQGFLAVEHPHSIHYRVYGNKDGVPALFLHGGPGAGCFSSHARFFDPSFYRIVRARSNAHRPTVADN